MVKDKQYYETQATEQEFLSWYKNQDLPTYPSPSYTADMLVFKYVGG